VIKNFYKFSLFLPVILQVKLRGYFGRNKEVELSVLKKIINKGDIVIDVGAHHGIYTYQLKRLVGKKGTIYGIEPQYELYQYLNLAFKKSKNVILINAAAYNINSTQKLYTPIHNDSLATGGASLKKQDVQNSVTSVNTITIDSLNLNRCNFIKIDVEGGELNVLEGSLSTIRKFHPILLIEIDFNLSGKDLTQTLSVLQSFKYKPYLFEKNKFESVDYDEFKSINVNRKYGRHTLNFFLI
jgi:FkbM family methyltransferase